MIGIIIQVRMGSNRLPGKVLMPIAGRPLLDHLLGRLKNGLHREVQVVVATSTLTENDSIAIYCRHNKITCFRGSEDDVLSRYYDCATVNNFEHIVRLTGDNPFIDVEELENLIKLHLKSKADYSRSFSALPKGVGSEIFTFNALEESFLYGFAENHKEHVNEYIEENEKKYRISELKVPKEKNRPEISLTVDNMDDYKKACFIIEHSKNEYTTTQEAIKLCSQFV